MPRKDIFALQGKRQKNNPRRCSGCLAQNGGFVAGTISICLRDWSELSRKRACLLPDTSGQEGMFIGFALTLFLAIVGKKKQNPLQSKRFFGLKTLVLFNDGFLLFRTNIGSAPVNFWLCECLLVPDLNGCVFFGIEMSSLWYRGGLSLLFGIEISFLVSRFCTLLFSI